MYLQNNSHTVKLREHFGRGDRVTVGARGPEYLLRYTTFCIYHEVAFTNPRMRRKKDQIHECPIKASCIGVFARDWPAGYFTLN